MENKIMKGILDSLFQIVMAGIIYFIYSVSLDIMLSFSQVELEKNLDLALNIIGSFILTIQTMIYLDIQDLKDKNNDC